MPVVLRLDGFTFFFFSNEGAPREPAHIHVRRDRDVAKFWIDGDVRYASSSGFDARTINRVTRLVEAHRDEFERPWHEFFGG